MFQPPIFREARIEVMHALMKNHPFATLVSLASGHLSADHLPLVLHPDIGVNGTLRGHIAVGNPLFGREEGPIEVLVVFQGPQAYISPSWYPSKKEHGKVVPTWNYAVAQARGILRFIRDLDWLMAHLRELSKRHEGSRADPWAVNDAPKDFIAAQLKGIVGIEIEVNSLVGKFKVSQNKSTADKQGVALGLLEEKSDHGRAMSDIVRDYSES
ncbi:MAG: FMN-binding negative transcriptional regulator [Devosiaceae bacterium]|nr:FMN-binding negative transcriptional regulator [Devosiaceae bacterium]